MVTIEQKLLLFSRLLNQSMDKKFEEEFKETEKQYKEKIQKNKEEIDKEVQAVEEKAKIGADVRRAQSSSKSKVMIKKEIMALNEKHYKIFMNKFKDTLYIFVQSDKYKNYLSNIISKLNEELFRCDELNNIIIYLTRADYSKYSEFIKQKIAKDQSNKNITFKTIETIIGGLIVENPENNFKVDMTIDAVLEDNKFYIMQTLIETLEAGGYNG